MTMNERTAAALIALVRANVPSDVQDLLVHGSLRAGVAPGALQKAIHAALATSSVPSPSRRGA